MEEEKILLKANEKDGIDGQLASYDMHAYPNLLLLFDYQIFRFHNLDFRFQN